MLKSQVPFEAHLEEHGVVFLGISWLQGELQTGAGLEFIQL